MKPPCEEQENDIWYYSPDDYHPYSPDLRSCCSTGYDYNEDMRVVEHRLLSRVKSLSINSVDKKLFEDEAQFDEGVDFSELIKNSAEPYKTNQWYSRMEPYRAESHPTNFAYSFTTYDSHGSSLIWKDNLTVGDQQLVYGGKTAWSEWRHCNQKIKWTIEVDVDIKLKNFFDGDSDAKAAFKGWMYACCARREFKITPSSGPACDLSVYGETLDLVKLGTIRLTRRCTWGIWRYRRTKFWWVGVLRSQGVMPGFDNPGTSTPPPSPYDGITTYGPGDSNGPQNTEIILQDDFEFGDSQDEVDVWEHDLCYGWHATANRSQSDKGRLVVYIGSVNWWNHVRWSNREAPGADVVYNTIPTSPTLTVWLQSYAGENDISPVDWGKKFFAENNEEKKNVTAITRIVEHHAPPNVGVIVANQVFVYGYTPLYGKIISPRDMSYETGEVESTVKLNWLFDRDDN